MPLVPLVGRSKSGSREPGGLANRPQGPQRFGNMMAKEWAKDLSDKAPAKRARAARELANMGPAAKSALPALERAATASCRPATLPTTPRTSLSG